MKEPITLDVIIVGGSYAGLSAAMTLGRSFRQVLVLDTGKPCNFQTPYAHNFITQDGETPSAITTRARAQVLKYETIQLLNAKVVQAKQSDDFIEVLTENGETFKARKVLFATGILDIMPDIAGFAACWGISVLHCPYCHGYEVRNEKIGILANGEMGFEMAKLISHWTKDLTLFTNGTATLNEAQIAKLKARQIPIVETEIARIEHDKGYIKALVFKNETTHKLSAIFARVGFVQHSDIPKTLGCDFTEAGHIKVDAFGKTNIPNIFAAGDCTTLLRSLSVAIAAGSIAGAFMNRELIEETF